MLLSRRRVCPLFLIVFRGLRSRLRGQQSRRLAPHSAVGGLLTRQRRWRPRAAMRNERVWRARISASRGARSSSRRRFAKPR